MNETWITLAEHHISTAFILSVCGFVFTKHRLYTRAKDRLNDLWWDRCGAKQEPYTPVENGSPAVVPPRPVHGD